jgi:hypothetical protein
MSSSVSRSVFNIFTALKPVVTIILEEYGHASLSAIPLGDVDWIDLAKDRNRWRGGMG